MINRGTEMSHSYSPDGANVHPPSSIWLLGRASLHPDRFSRFCNAHQCVINTETGKETMKRQDKRRKRPHHPSTACWRCDLSLYTVISARRSLGCFDTVGSVKVRLHFTSGWYNRLSSVNTVSQKRHRNRLYN